MERDECSPDRFETKTKDIVAAVGEKGDTSARVVDVAPVGCTSSLLDSQCDSTTMAKIVDSTSWLFSMHCNAAAAVVVVVAADGKCCYLNWSMDSRDAC